MDNTSDHTNINEAIPTPTAASMQEKSHSFLKGAFLKKSKSASSQHSSQHASFDESSSNDDGRQELVMLTERSLMMVEVFASKDSKPEVLWSIDLSNIENVTTSDDGKILMIEKKYKISKSLLEKLGKSGLWKGRNIMCEDQFLSWESKGKLLGAIRFSSNDCRCSGRKIFVKGNMTSQSKKGRKAGKMKEIILRASTIRSAAEFCGGMKELNVSVENVKSERVERLVSKLTSKLTSMVRDVGDSREEDEMITPAAHGRRRSSLSMNEGGVRVLHVDGGAAAEEDDSSEEEKEDGEEIEEEEGDDDDDDDDSMVFAGTPGRERNVSLDSMASLDSIEDMLLL